ncbi:MAG: hypothetical protein H9535_20895 [Ignavibacteria bacterium]|nr:hypothetical protein [Ignavibacteria bacterium]
MAQTSGFVGLSGENEQDSTADAVSTTGGIGSAGEHATSNTKPSTGSKRKNTMTTPYREMGKTVREEASRC